MILSKPTASDGALGEKADEDSADGFTIGGDMNFYEWDHESSMQPKE